MRGAGLAVSFARRADVAPAILGSLVFAVAVLAFDPAAGSQAPQSSALYAAGGELLGATVASDGQWRLKASGPVPDRFVGALVLYEDKRFFGHAGFDPAAIVRAMLANGKAGRVVSGGSTLTMQVARLSGKPGARTWGAKLTELWMAVRLEAHHTKSGILSLYAERAPFGGNVVGLEAAGFRWFGRPPQMLTWAEAATLAVLPNSPALVHPGRSRDELRRKRDGLLSRLVAVGRMPSGDLATALAEPLPGAPLPMPNLAPHLLARSGPGRSTTTIDLSTQMWVQERAARYAARLELHDIHNLAAIVMRVDDGSLAAYVGNVPVPVSGGSRMPAEQLASWVDCAAAPRSSGSILKPFLYAAMLDSGELSPSRLVPDIPTRIGSYSPENNLKSYAGAVRADEALARSLNVPFVRLLRSYGVERFASTLKRLGFSTLSRAPADYGLTLILGGAEVTLLDAASAYAALARAAKGVAGEAVHGKPARVAVAPFSAGAAWLTLQALVQVARPGEDASWQEYASSRRIAWKTGTSFGSRDAWAIGVTPSWVVGVWVGNADGSGRPELKGTDTAAPLLFDLFQNLPQSRWFDEPVSSLRYETVCADSGYVAGPDCARTTRILVSAAAKTDQVCPYCRVIHLSADGRYRVRAESAGSLGLVTERRFVLPPAIEWYYQRSTLGYRLLPPWAPGMAGPESDALEFIAPEEGASIFVPIELDGRPGMTIFRVAHRGGSTRLFWHLDGDYLGETTTDHRMEAHPAAGWHTLVVVDEDGSSTTRRFEVYARR
jgi:penicillin-binding protein 1C